MTVISVRTLVPVKTIFPDARMRRTTFGLIISVKKIVQYVERTEVYKPLVHNC